VEVPASKCFYARITITVVCNFDPSVVCARSMCTKGASHVAPVGFGVTATAHGSSVWHINFKKNIVLFIIEKGSSLLLALGCSILSSRHFHIKGKDALCAP
jgi:hypothetical protein